LSRAARTERSCPQEERSVLAASPITPCLVRLVDLVYLVPLVYPVRLVQPNTQNKPNKQNK
jgi:hypothetical protein